MFHQTSLRLTGLYLGIIMAISIFFSVALYNLSMHEVDRGFDRQTEVVQRVFGSGPFRQQSYIQQREDIYNDIRGHVIAQLIFINLLIMVGAGFLSYYLARRTLKPIEEAHQAQSRFTADASHELRTPITAMRTEIEVTLSDPKLKLADAKDQLQSNLEELDKLTALSEGLLRLAQLEASDLPKEAVSVHTLVQAAVDRVLPLAEPKHNLVSQSVPADAQVLGDQAGLTEALVTVLDNAVKYSPKKSQVTVVAKPGRGDVIITVTDQGPGISEEELPHIFERFYRADSSRTKGTTDGYGLGLAIAQNIVQLHGGSITAESSLGKGTTVTISLPKA
ncbi:MAG: two-component system, OmpR family, sensor histidine kinase CiaH [Patescibacteria group bacterium]|nr:two-component system, OmpR family, sensor histidine kinase CiaH [Patescibacteria group bacterium]